MKIITRILQSYTVIKSKTNKGPLPNMTQYHLQDHSGQTISFWNDVPIQFNKDCVTCGVQIPKQLHGKFQVIKELPNHPFMQDTRKNLFTKQLERRFYAQFPLFNYGFIPQTWEQNFVKDSRGFFGDDDPIDICDLSSTKREPGDFFKGKILGSFCLIDQGETDWKILVMDEQQCNAKNINSVQDIDPRWIQSIKKWFIGIKVYDGKKENTIAYGNKTISKEETIQVVKETYDCWKDLLSSQDPLRVNKRKQFHLERKIF